MYNYINKIHLHKMLSGLKKVDENLLFCYFYTRFYIITNINITNTKIDMVVFVFIRY